MRTTIETIKSIQLSQQFGNSDKVLVLCDAQYQPIEITLPQPDTVDDLDITIVKTDSTSNAVSLVAPYGATIYGTASTTTQYDSLSVASDLKSKYFIV